MNPTDQQIACAEECGWKNEIRRSYRDTPGWFHPNGISMYDYTPNYLEDWNTRKEMIAVMSRNQHDNMLAILQDEDRPLARLIFTLDQPTFVKCFLKVRGRWKE